MNTPRRQLRAVLPRVSRLLLAVYLVVVITQMLPLALADTGWWLRWIGVATSNGVILVLAALIAVLGRGRTTQALRRQRRFAVAAGLAFALLIPLQLGVALLQAQQVSRAEQTRVAQLQSRFDLIADTAATAGSREALQELAARLSGDATRPLRLPPALDAARTQVVDQISLGRRQAMAAMERAIAARRLRAVLDSVRVVGLALLLGLALWTLR